MRRQFLKQLFFLGAFWGPTQKGFSLQRFQDSKWIRENMNFKPGLPSRDNWVLEPHITYLNNGTMGVSPQVVLQEVQEQMFKTDSQGIYGGGEKPLLDALSELFSVSPQSLALTHNVTEEPIWCSPD